MRMGNSRWLRNSLVYLLIIIGVIVIFYTLIPAFGTRNDLPLTEVIAKAQNHEISEIIVEGDKLTVIPIVTGGAGGSQYTSRINEQTSIMEVLADNDVETGPGGVQVTFKGSGGLGSFLGLLLNFLPLIFFGGLILFMMRQAQGSNNQTLSFGRSRARMMPFNRPTVTFSDVAGVDEAKTELVEVVEFLKYPERFPFPGGPHSQGRAAGGPARHRQDPAGPGRGRRSRGTLLPHQRQRICRNVRGRGRGPGSRPV